MDNLNGIQIIDCKGISSKSLREIQETEEFKVFTKQFGDAMKLNGIVYLINTEVEKSVILNFEQKLAEFYSLPFDVKNRYNPDVFGLSKYGSWGWRGPTPEFKKNNHTIETFDLTSNPQFADDSLYPKEIDGFKDAVFSFRKQTRNLSNKLLRSIAEYLQFEDKDFLIQKHRALEENFALSKFSVRTLFYPMEPERHENSVKIRLPEHQDFGTLTHIYQNSQGGGLQAKLSNGEWVDVEYVPNSFVVNAGRSLEMWSGGNIPAVLHRVGWGSRSKTESRLSFGCFLGPDRDTCTLPQIPENPNWKPVYTRMQPGETFDDYFRAQVLFAEKTNQTK